MAIPIIDIFAGPGGLGEGFSSFKVGKNHPFRTVLSVEKDYWAHKTLLLRSFFRQFAHRGRRVPKAYYDFLEQQAGPLPRSRKQLEQKQSFDDLFSGFREEADAAIHEARQIELGGEAGHDDPRSVRRIIDDALKGEDYWILLGGPPCQAYSNALKARKKREGGIDPNDPRLRLYRHYLWILANHRPAAFIFENVHGLTSSQVNDEHLLPKLLKSLQEPHAELQGDYRFPVTSERSPVRYRLFGLEKPKTELDEVLDTPALNEIIVKAERHEIPQARHRFVILGIREDLGERTPGKLQVSENKISIESVLSGLPKLRSQISLKGCEDKTESFDRWKKAVRMIQENSFAPPGNRGFANLVAKKIKSVVDSLEKSPRSIGANYVQCRLSRPRFREDWYFDSRLNGVCNHYTRKHKATDLHRYLYASAFAQLSKKGPEGTPTFPRLEHFPRDLWPDHKNVEEAVKTKSNHNDRFRVQVKGAPAKTITSHLHKDGHAFIHYDPRQIRSLTVREAARVQTFPDNYFFCGPQGNSYTQVGNAVPPLLANQIAGVVWEYLKECGIA